MYFLHIIFNPIHSYLALYTNFPTLQMHIVHVHNIYRTLMHLILLSIFQLATHEASRASINAITFHYN